MNIKMIPRLIWELFLVRRDFQRLIKPELKKINEKVKQDLKEIGKI